MVLAKCPCVAADLYLFLFVFYPSLSYFYSRFSFSPRRTWSISGKQALTIHVKVLCYRFCPRGVPGSQISPPISLALPLPLSPVLSLSHIPSLSLNRTWIGSPARHESRSWVRLTCRWFRRLRYELLSVQQDRMGRRRCWADSAGRVSGQNRRYNKFV
jgi:hypothetical protein